MVVTLIQCRHQSVSRHFTLINFIVQSNITSLYLHGTSPKKLLTVGGLLYCFDLPDYLSTTPFTVNVCPRYSISSAANTQLLQSCFTCFQQHLLDMFYINAPSCRAHHQDELTQTHYSHSFPGNNWLINP